jgi:hypothetical protein
MAASTICIEELPLQVPAWVQNGLDGGIVAAACTLVGPATMILVRVVAQRHLLKFVFAGEEACDEGSFWRGDLSRVGFRVRGGPVGTSYEERCQTEKGSDGGSQVAIAQGACVFLPSFDGTKVLECGGHVLSSLNDRLQHITQASSHVCNLTDLLSAFSGTRTPFFFLGSVAPGGRLGLALLLLFDCELPSSWMVLRNHVTFEKLFPNGVTLGMNRVGLSNREVGKGKVCS